MHAAILSLSLLATAADGSTADRPADASPPLPPPRSAPSAQAPADDPSLPPLPMPREPLPAEPAPEAPVPEARAPEAPAPEAPVPSPTGASTVPVSRPSPQPTRPPVQPATPAAGLPVSRPSARPPTSPALVRPRGSEAYAGRLAFVDGVGWAVMLVGLKGNSAGPLVLGIGSLALAAPIVHMAKGHPGRAWGSFGLRVGGVVLGGTLGGLGGAVVGFVAAEAIDILALGGVAANRRIRRDGALAVTPVLAPTPGGGLLGVAATF